jgi:hypothetical protein
VIEVIEGAVVSAGCVELLTIGTPLTACKLSLPLKYV